ncbi:E3 ubiquitin-protein ligase TRIM21-like [Aulostomus maculatus]
MASTLSVDQFRCSICLDIFRDPVSIPCGHNFCLECIKHFWDKSKRKSDCPLCKEIFIRRPDLRINVGLKDITEQFKRSQRQKSSRVRPSRKGIPDQFTVNVPCDSCNSKAVKSCLVCQASYCESHLVPHLLDPVMTKHRLMDPVTHSTVHLCQNHNKVLEIFCKTDNIPVCLKCKDDDHKNHEMVPLDKESKRIKGIVKTTKAEFQELISSRLNKMEEISNSVERSKVTKESQVHSSTQIITMVLNAVERNHAMLTEEMEQRQEAAEMRAKELLLELKQEMIELQRRHSQLQHLEHTSNPVHLLQSVTPLSSPVSTRDWSKVQIPSDNHIGVVRRAFSKLVTICQGYEKKLSTEEVRKLNQYAEDITLDPATAAGWLILSPDRKKVSISSQQRNPPPPDNPRRFNSCVSVLGEQSFTSGRHYWVVEVGNKSDWDLGVARESINRKGAIRVCPDSGYWAICRRKGGSLNACAGPSFPLYLEETPQKVGVFLDYEEGLVSFYDTEAKTHIYTYSGLMFTEPLYPYLNPCLHDKGKNTAPLIICPFQELCATTKL